MTDIIQKKCGWALERKERPDTLDVRCRDDELVGTITIRRKECPNPVHHITYLSFDIVTSRRAIDDVSPACTSTLKHIGDAQDADDTTGRCDFHKVKRSRRLQWSREAVKSQLSQKGGTAQNNRPARCT